MNKILSLSRKYIAKLIYVMHISQRLNILLRHANNILNDINILVTKIYRNNTN